MPSAGQPLFVRDTLEKLRELAPLGVAQCGQNSRLVLARNAGDLAQYLSPLFGQVEGITTAVVRIVAAFD